MTYNGLGLQSYGRRARRAHFLLGWAILVPYMDASGGFAAWAAVFKGVKQDTSGSHRTGLYNRSFWLCVQYLG